MSKRIKEVSAVQRKKVYARAINSDLMDTLIEGWPGVHPLLRISKPLKDIPSTVRFEFILVSYESTSNFKEDETADEYLGDTIPERNRELELAKKKKMVPYSPFYLFLDTDADLPNRLSRLGFKFAPKRLYLFIMLFPRAILPFMHDKERIIFPHFETNKSEVSDINRVSIALFGRYLRNTWSTDNKSFDFFMPVQSLFILGHTDQVGKEEKNKSLGLRRAESIRRYILKELTGHHLRESITIDSSGEFEPLESKVEEASSLNRRVEVFVSYHENNNEKLKLIKTAILNLAQNVNGASDQYKCIGEALTNSAIEDKYFRFLNPMSKHYPNLRLRTLLLDLKYRNKSDKEIFEFLSKQIQLMYDAAWETESHHRYSEHSNNKRRRAWIKKRVGENPKIPSIWGCTTIK